MEEVTKGVYRYKGELEGSGDVPLVGVHLWYNQFRKHNLFRVNNVKPKGEYLSNLDRLWKESTGRNIFLFEEGQYGGVPISAAKTISEVRGDDKGIYIVPTYVASSVPISDSWEEVCNFIYEMSSSVDLAGGFINNRHDGCLGRALRMFKGRGFDSSLVEGCCFC